MDASLPMAVEGCGLNAADLGAQADRYRRLGARARRVERAGLELRVVFGGTVEAGLVEETIQVERGCCSFFSLEYDRAARRLTIAVTGDDHASALDAVEAAIRRGAARG